MEQTPSAPVLPDLNRVSVLTATILLAYALARFLVIPVWEISFDLLGVYFELALDLQSVMVLMAAALTVAGADWLYFDHPALHGRSRVPFGVLPALTALVLGVVLNQMPFNANWWLGLFGGGAALSLVLAGEYLSINIEDVRHPLAGALLIAAAFALFLALGTSLVTAGLRLYVLAPAVFLEAFMVSLRVLHLRLQGEWAVYDALVIAFVVGQLAAGLHYWAVSPIDFALLLVGPTYALNSLFVTWVEERSLRQSWWEPSLALVLTLLAVLWSP